MVGLYGRINLTIIFLGFIHSFFWNKYNCDETKENDY